MSFFDRLSGVTSNIHGYVEQRAVGGRLKKSAKSIGKPRARLEFAGTAARRLHSDVQQAARMVAAVRVEDVPDPTERQEITQLKNAALAELQKASSGSVTSYNSVVAVDRALESLQTRLREAAGHSRSFRQSLEQTEQHAQMRPSAADLQPPPAERKRRRFRPLTQESINKPAGWATQAFQSFAP